MKVEHHTVARVRQALQAAPRGLTLRDLMRRTGVPSTAIVFVLDVLQRANSVKRKRDFARARMPYVYQLSLPSPSTLSGQQG